MRENYYENVVMDSVHGSIQLFDHEMNVIDHPYFQRLRFVSQNDVLSLVFPGATHARFSHSIGAMHVSQLIWDGIINQNQRYRVIKRNPTRQEEDALAYLNKCVRLAILLHDTGHAAFSHQFEDTPGIRAAQQSPGLFEALWRGIDVSALYPSVPESICHEHYSVRVAHAILSESLSEKDRIAIHDVLSIMETTETCVSVRFQESCLLASVFFTGHREWKDCGYDLVEKMLNLLRCFISCEFDADKGDYLLRDSHHTGVSYGKYDLSSMAGNFSTAEDDEWFGMVVNRKGLGALADFVMSRFNMYRQVYNHKTSNGFEMTLKMAIDEIIQQDSVRGIVLDALSDIDGYCNLVDGYFWNEFRLYAKKFPNSASAAIVKRKPMKFLVALEDASATEIDAKRSEMANALGVTLESIVCATSKIRFSKISEDYDTIRVRDVDTITEAVTLRKISEITDFYGHFSDVAVTHLYQCPWLTSRSGI